MRISVSRILRLIVEEIKSDNPNLMLRQVFECVRRLLLTGVLVFVPDKSGQAAAYGCIFAFLRYGWEDRLLYDHPAR